MPGLRHGIGTASVPIAVGLCAATCTIRWTGVMTACAAVPMPDPTPGRPTAKIGGCEGRHRAVPGALALLTLLIAACGTAPAGEPVQIGVPPGSSLSAVADTLQARGVLSSTTWFKMLGRIRGVDRQLRPGRFALTPGASAGELLDQLVNSESMELRVTLPEGGTIWDLARSAESSLGMPADSILAAARDSALRAEFGITAPTVEGWLRPETYFFGAYDSPREVVRRFLLARKEAWPSDWRARADAVDLDQDQVLSLASIVEAEAFLPEELPRIAAVYRNRLRIGMALQADPTIQYAFLLDRGRREERLFNRGLRLPVALQHVPAPRPAAHPGRQSERCRD